MIVHVPARVRLRVSVLDQQPFRLLRSWTCRRGLCLYKDKTSSKPTASQSELQLSLVELFPRFPNAFVSSLVPNLNGSRSVIAFRDHAFELPVLEWMVFGFHGQPLVIGVQRRPLGNRPRLEDPVHFQAQVVVQAARGVSLHNKDRRGTRRRRQLLLAAARGLGCLFKATFLAIGDQRHGRVGTSRFYFPPRRGPSTR